MFAVVSGVDDNVIWRLKGQHSDFEDPAGSDATNVCCQHDEQFVISDDSSDDDEGKWNEISLFNNHARHATASTSGCEHDCSHAL